MRLRSRRSSVFRREMSQPRFTALRTSLHVVFAKEAAMGDEIRTHNHSGSDMTDVWKSQPVGSIEISLAEIHRKASRFEKRISRRNLREYVAGVIVIVFFGYYISIFHSALTRAGCGLVIAGALFIGLTLHKRGPSKAIPADLAVRSGTEFL